MHLTLQKPWKIHSWKHVPNYKGMYHKVLFSTMSHLLSDYTRYLMVENNSIRSSSAYYSGPESHIDVHTINWLLDST